MPVINLTPVQERYLLEVEGMVASHTTKDARHYRDAVELQEKGLFRLTESEGPMILTSLTKAGRNYAQSLKQRQTAGAA